MDEVNKMFRTIVNGQSAMKQELLSKIDSVDKKVEGLDKKIDGVEERLTKRIDTIGLSVARLEDDAPTRDEHDKLEKRVTKIERKLQIQTT